MPKNEYPTRKDFYQIHNATKSKELYSQFDVSCEKRDDYRAFSRPLLGAIIRIIKIIKKNYYK